MSVRTGGAGGGNSGHVYDHTITTADIDYNAPYTVCFWVYVETAGEDNKYLLRIYTSAIYDQLRWSNDKIKLMASDGTDTTVTSASDLAMDTWMHICLVRASATDLKFYVDNVEICSNTKDVGTSRTDATVMFVGYGNSSAWTATTNDALVADVKIFDKALDSDERAAEALAAAPADYTNCTSFVPCRLYAPVDVNSKPDDLIGTFTIRSDGPPALEADPPDVPYWRSVARSVGINTKGPG